MKIMIFDSAEKSFVGSTWRMGSVLFSKSFDKVFAATSRDRVYETLSKFGIGSIKELQLWGHGSPGKMFFGGRSLDPNLDVWKVVAGGSLWMRSCDSLRGEVGHDLARAFSRHGISVAGHLGVIGTWAMQSFLVGLKRGHEPWWSVQYDGGNSAPWKPRTVSALDMKLPLWAFEQRPSLGVSS